MHNVSNRLKQTQTFTREPSCYELRRASVNPCFEKPASRFPPLCPITQTVSGTPETASSNPQPLFAIPRLHFPTQWSARFPPCRWISLFPFLAASRARPHHPIIDAHSAPLCCLPAVAGSSREAARAPSNVSTLSAPRSNLQTDASSPRGSAILPASGDHAATIHIKRLSPAA